MTVNQPIPHLDEGRFRRSVQEVLSHLYQPAYLRAHPLAAALVEAGLIRTADDLPTLMLSTIEQLCPRGPAPRNSPGWRQYHYLRLRYVECATHRRIAERLQISTRQACREHDAGLGAVARLLSGSHASTPSATRHAEPTASEEAPADAAAEPLRGQTAEEELLRVGSEPPDGPTNLGEVLNGALATVARVIAARGLAVRVVMPPDLPPVEVNRLALRHILLNLLGYLTEGTSSETLTIAADVEAGAVRLSFVPGVGHASTDAPRPVATEHPGLAVARRLAEMQGGQLLVQAPGNVPDWAILVLPATQATTVLLVDDSADIGRLFRRYLSGTGYCLVQARSAEKARRMVHEVRPGVILLDVLLPKDDGWQLLEDLRADESTASVPVIACSVVPEQSLAVALGVTFLPKPISRQALVTALDAATAERSA